MQGLLFACSVIVVLCACGSPQGVGSFEPIWSQRAEERGRLPIGQVTVVERIEPRDARPIAQQAPAGAIPGAGVSANTGGVVAATAGGSAQLYRYTLRMSGGATRQAEAEYLFKIGDCVAIRTGAGGQASLVSALAQACP